MHEQLKHWIKTFTKLEIYQDCSLLFWKCGNISDLFSWKQIKNPFPLHGTSQGKVSHTNERSNTQKLCWTAQSVLWRFYQFCSPVWRKMFPIKWLIKTSMGDFITSVTTKKCTYWLFKYNWVIRKKLWFLLRKRNIWKLQKEISAVLDPFCEYRKSLNSVLLFKGLRLGIQKNYLLTYRVLEMPHVEYKSQF